MTKNKSKYSITLFIIILSTFIFACSSNINSESNSMGMKSTNVSEVTDFKWLLSDIAGHDNYKPAYQNFTLVFHEKMVSGKAFNNFTSGYEIKPNGTISVSEKMVSTRKAIANTELADLERDYMSKIMYAKKWSLDGDNLTITSKNGTLKFRRSK